jgi:exocyst complex component 6
MCLAAVGLISKALGEVDNAESLLNIKNLVALFMQAMKVWKLYLFFRSLWVRKLIDLQTWGFSTTVFDEFLLTLFEKYAELLKKRFSDDFQEVFTSIS